MTKYINDPREIKSRFATKCAETGKEIKKGETCIYYPSTSAVYHVDSKQADKFRSWKFDSEVLGYNY